MVTNKKIKESNLMKNVHYMQSFDEFFIGFLNLGIRF